MAREEANIGIDGGASRWKWAAETPGGRRLEGESPGLNANQVAEADFLEHLAHGVQEIMRTVGAREEELISIGLGMSGIDRPDEVRRLSGWVHARWPRLRRVWIGNDAHPALVEATGERAGIVCIAGTGSLAWGCTASGQTARAGGWGAALGDEGSGWMIGRQALTLATRMADGRRPPTVLLDVLLKHLHLEDPSRLIGWARERNPSQLKQEVAALAPAVLLAAETGDAPARAIRAQALAHLALMVSSVERQLEQYEGSTKAKSGPITSRPLVCTGGLWHHAGLLDGLHQSLIRMGLSDLKPIRLEGSAAWGALRLGREAAPSEPDGVA